jgi:hypothetical protein
VKQSPKPISPLRGWIPIIVLPPAVMIVFDVKDFLYAWWLKLGYLALTILFAGFTFVYGYAVLWPAK